MSHWWETAVTYQVYVRSFADSTGDGIGDLDGITSRLPHIASLGVDAIWLNPCYPSPQKDHGYDVADYFDIEPDYGTLEDFDALVAAAAAHDIKVLMDVVPNHCSDQHAWFQAALAAGPGSAERERFYFRDGRGDDGDLPPNDWTAIFGGSAWTRITEPDGTPGQWYLGVFTPHQPDFCWDSPDVVAHFDDVFRFWFDRGVEGFRADAVTILGKEAGLPDHGHEVPFGRVNPFFDAHPSGHAAWTHWRKTIDAYNAEHDRDVFVIAEAYLPRRPDLFAQYVNDAEFHQGFSFDLLLSPWRADDLRQAVEETLSTTAQTGASPAWTLNNHDCQRSVTRYGRADAAEPVDITRGNLVSSTAPVDLDLGERRAAAMLLFQLGLPGSVFLYAGEELGLPEVLDLPDEARQDPIVTLTGGEQLGRDGCRVPLPWTSDPADAHGFSPPGSVATPWLPQPTGWGAYAAAAQDGKAASMLTLYREAVRMRARVLGKPFSWIDVGIEGVIGYRRGDVAVFLNTADLGLDLPLGDGAEVLIASSDARGTPRSNTLPSGACAWVGS